MTLRRAVSDPTSIAQPSSLSSICHISVVLNMTSLDGSIASVNSKVTATFFRDGKPVTYLAVVNVSIPDFQASAKLNYTEQSQLIGTQTFHGQLGPNTVELTTASGATMSGPLVLPVIPAISLGGSGIWTKS
ncbi:hypothetical protein BDW22DRAFT_1346794 [Trametopsis cervina]|nr:hypothetical protein BDW22DRAFT_1346794 [Trametopsis cervina]